MYVFDSVAQLVAFVRSGTDNDLVDHPAWADVTEAHAQTFEPADANQYDLVAVEELVSEKPTGESVATLAGVLAIVSSIGSVCELAPVSKFFNGNPSLGTVAGGIDHFTGKAGLKRWNAIAAIISRSWDDVLASIEGIVSTPDVDATLSAKAADELAEERPEPETSEDAEGAEATAATAAAGAVAVAVAVADEAHESDTDDAGESDDAVGAAGRATAGAVVPRAVGDTAVLGSDEDFWLKVGIDPIRIMTSSGTFYTLRCYLDDRPIFLGRNGRISVFGSERALARYLADEHDHDLANLSTYDDIRTAATDGSLTVDVTDENIYVLSGLADDFADGPDAVDRDQLDLAVELLHDIGDYSEESTVDKALETSRPLGTLIASVLEPDSTERPAPPYAVAVREWEKLEQFVDGRLRRE